MSVLSFRVFGIPRPGGSKRAFYNKKLGRAMIVDSSNKVKSWKQDVKEAAIMNAGNIVPLICPIELEVVFYMPRPKAHYRTGKHAGELKENAPKWHTHKPDTTKLLRGTEDALTGILWKDDSQIFRQLIVKMYDEIPGADISIRWGEDEG